MNVLTPISGFCNYSITRDGRIYSALTNRFLTPTIPDGRYPTVMLTIAGKRKRLYVHRLIYSTFVGPIPDGFEIDHINRVKSDNCIENLRCVKHRTNQHNHNKHVPPSRQPKTVYKGVHAQSPFHRKPWRAAIAVDGKFIRLGTFDSDLDAALVFDEAAVRIHGDNAVTNKALGLL